MSKRADVQKGNCPKEQMSQRGKRANVHHCKCPRGQVSGRANAQEGKCREMQMSKREYVQNYNLQMSKRASRRWVKWKRAKGKRPETVRWNHAEPFGLLSIMMLKKERARNYNALASCGFRISSIIGDAKSNARNEAIWDSLRGWWSKSFEIQDGVERIVTYSWWSVGHKYATQYIIITWHARFLKPFMSCSSKELLRMIRWKRVKPTSDPVIIVLMLQIWNLVAATGWKQKYLS